ncbi:MAG: hypothetical protein GY719_18925 [bacterium]|nr:hypothetical protein [bacterium]
MDDLSARIAMGELILLDGATGTELERRGVPMDAAAWRTTIAAVLLATSLTGACASGASSAPVAVRAAVRASAGCGTPPPVVPGKSGTVAMRAGGLEREYRVHLPPDYDPGRAVSLVLHFHGYTGTAESTESYTGLSRHADEYGYAVVYPQSTAFVTDEGHSITSWNDLAGSASPGPAGPICAETADKYPHPPECGEARPCNWASCHDDLGFIELMLDRLEETLCIDLDRIYATGMSNGGMLVHRLGCAMPERLAAIAPVGGTLARGFNCAPGASTPLSMMNVYGTRDDYVSQKGVESSDGYYYTSAEDVMKKWASAKSQGCDPASTPYQTSRTGAFGLACIQHDGCTTGAEVVHCAWDGAHDWPRDDADNFGNDIIWDFFSKHSRFSAGR